MHEHSLKIARIAAVTAMLLAPFAAPAGAEEKPAPAQPAAAPAAAPQVRQEDRTIFYYAPKAWAVGVIKLSVPMKFRDGKVLAFPAEIRELTWAPKNTKPKNLMLTYEMSSSEKDKPFFNQGDEFFAPIQLLPDHTYWKDNLPNTRRHAVYGGRRYAFRGEDIAEAKKVVGDFLATADPAVTERSKKQASIVASALNAKSKVLREDAVTWLSTSPTLASDFGADALPALETYLAGDAPAGDKAKLVDAFVAAKAEVVKPVLEKLRGREDATGAVVLNGLEGFGSGSDTERLLKLSRSEIVDLRVYAARGLGRRAASDEAAFARATELLADTKEKSEVVAAAAQGLGESGSDKAVPPLAKGLVAGDMASRPAAEALGRINTPAAWDVLLKALKENSGEPALAAVGGLAQTRGCNLCAVTLEKQHEEHPDPEIRKLIAVVLELPLEHKH